MQQKPKSKKDRLKKKLADIKRGKWNPTAVELARLKKLAK